MRSSAIGIVLCLMLSSCTFSVPQAESALRWVKSFSQDQEDDPKKTPIWLASVGESGTVLKPYTAGEFIVFANTDGDAITFDGWIVRSITGFGLKEPLSVSGREGRRSFVSGQSVFDLRCGSWVWRQSTWKQRCDHGTSEILLDESGNIQKISMSLTEKLGFVTLRVAN